VIFFSVSRPIQSIALHIIKSFHEELKQYEISGSQGDEHEDESLLEYSAV